jgi:phosphotransferase system HPr (HPr) family protein
VDEGPGIRHAITNGLPMLSRSVVITNPQGLHMRPAAAFAEMARKYDSQVFVKYQDHSVDGKSLFSLLMLAAEAGTELILEVCGTDAENALPTLANILGSPSADMS